MPTNRLVKLIDACIIPKPKPAVYISGGFDSTIILHHLSEKTDEPIYTYTFGFAPDDNEFEPAQKVAEHYGTVHREILLDNLLARYPEILQHFPFPRFNIWIWWLAEAAAKDTRQSAYTGEGGDEQFGGYWYRPQSTYVSLWKDHYEYIKPTYEIAHNHFNIELVMPFSMLDFRKTLPFWDAKREKTHLRQAYKGILPEFVLNRRKKSGGADYIKFWKRELSAKFPLHPADDEPTASTIRKLWQQYATYVWLQTRKKVQF